MTGKVLFIINDLRMGGAQRVLSVVMKGLINYGYGVSLITNQQSSTDFYVPGENVIRYSTGLSNPSENIINATVNNLKRIHKIRQLITKESPDAVFSFMTETNVLALLATLFTNNRVIISERSDPEKEKKSFIWDVLRRLTYKRAAVVTSNSQGTLSYLKNIVCKDKLSYLPNPIEQCPEDGLYNTGNGTTIDILAVSRLHYDKGIDILIDALAELKSRSKEYQLWIAGDGPEKGNLKRQSKRLSVEDNIHWLGEINSLQPLYKSASIFVLPSRLEGMPNAMLEAISCGLPVIVSNASPGPLEYIVNGETGIVFQSGSSDSLAEAIVKLMEDKDMQLSMSEKSLERIQPFLLSNILPLWIKVIFDNELKGNVPVDS